MKYIFRWCEKLDDSEPIYERWGSDYIMMFEDGTMDQSTYSLYEIKNFGFDVELFKIWVRYVSGKIVQDEEGASFWNF